MRASGSCSSKSCQYAHSKNELRQPTRCTFLSVDQVTKPFRRTNLPASGATRSSRQRGLLETQSSEHSELSECLRRIPDKQTAEGNRERRKEEVTALSRTQSHRDIDTACSRTSVYGSGIISANKYLTRDAKERENPNDNDRRACSASQRRSELRAGPMDTVKVAKYQDRNISDADSQLGLKTAEKGRNHSGELLRSEDQHDYAHPAKVKGVAQREVPRNIGSLIEPLSPVLCSAPGGRVTPLRRSRQELADRAAATSAAAAQAVGELVPMKASGTQRQEATTSSPRGNVCCRGTRRQFESFPGSPTTGRVMRSTSSQRQRDVQNINSRSQPIVLMTSNGSPAGHAETSSVRCASDGYCSPAPSGLQQSDKAGCETAMEMRSVGCTIDASQPSRPGLYCNAQPTPLLHASDYAGHVHSMSAVPPCYMGSSNELPAQHNAIPLSTSASWAPGTVLVPSHGYWPGFKPHDYAACLNASIMSQPSDCLPHMSMGTYDGSLSTGWLAAVESSASMYPIPPETVAPPSYRTSDSVGHVLQLAHPGYPQMTASSIDGYSIAPVPKLPETATLSSTSWCHLVCASTGTQMEPCGAAIGKSLLKEDHEALSLGQADGHAPMLVDAYTESNLSLKSRTVTNSGPLSHCQPICALDLGRNSPKTDCSGLSSNVSATTEYDIDISKSAQIAKLADGRSYGKVLNQNLATSTIVVPACSDRPHAPATCITPYPLESITPLSPDCSTMKATLQGRAHSEGFPVAAFQRIRHPEGGADKACSPDKQWMLPPPLIPSPSLGGPGDDPRIGVHSEAFATSYPAPYGTADQHPEKMFFPQLRHTPAHAFGILTLLPNLSAEVLGAAMPACYED
eukprot:GHVT01047825.1.p1 GENE.GHVT01047825.1~~GHVT01047825.1.p1  ORF type:complete len:856 (+),score=38.17 GHVT01047825.1:574-3141(+)